MEPRPNLNYRVLDYALDMTDTAALTKSLNLNEPGGNEISIYTIGLGAAGGDTSDPFNVSIGEQLLRYMAAVGDDGDRQTDPCQTVGSAAYLRAVLLRAIRRGIGRHLPGYCLPNLHPNLGVNLMKKVTLQFSRFRSHLRSNPGQSMVEFAIALPILLLLVFGIIEFGRILQAWLAIENGARFGVRYAVTGNYDSQYCMAAVNAMTADLGLTAAEEADGSDDCIIEDAIGNQVDDLSVPLQDYARLLTIRDVSLQGATGIAYNLDDPVSGNYEDFLTAAHTTLDDGLSTRITVGTQASQVFLM